MRALLLCVLCIGCAGESATDPSTDSSTRDDAAIPVDTALTDVPDTTLEPDAALPDVADASVSLLPAESSCVPAAPTCPRGVAEIAIRANYRKDSYLPTYAEDGDVPSTGGRVHIAAVSAVTGSITRVVVDGLDVTSLSTAARPAIEWAHTWPKELVAGEPVFVQFHSRDAKWDTVASGRVRIETAAGVAVDSDFPVTRTTTPITWVTTSSDRRTLLVHVANRSGAPRTVNRVILDGRDVTAATCLAEKTFSTTALLTIPLCEEARDGAAYTLALEYESGGPSVAVGRYVRPFYPVEAWNNTGECPFPGGSAANYEAIVTKGGVDTLYTHGGVCARCGCDTFKLVNETLPAVSLRTLLTDDLPTALPKLTNTTSVAAISTGDESDGSVFDGTQSVPAKKAERTETMWRLYPEVPTFNGGKTNKNIGTFAGMADVQGMDFYIGACAPHITRFGTDYPLRGAYDYLRNTRENHMPLPTWLYAQGLSPAWHKEVTVGGVKIVDYFGDPSPSEILVQAFQVYAAGGKGFLWFQVNQDRAKASPSSWAAIVAVNKITRALRELLREGDLTGLATTPQKALVEAIRSRDAIVVPVINEEVTARPTDTSCNTAANAASMPHWKFGAQKVTVNVAIPRDLAVDDVFEVTADGVRELPASIMGRVVTVKDLALDEGTPARVFVIARTKLVRSSLMK